MFDPSAIIQFVQDIQCCTVVAVPAAEMPTEWILITTRDYY